MRFAIVTWPENSGRSIGGTILMEFDRIDSARARSEGRRQAMRRRTCPVAAAK